MNKYLSNLIADLPESSLELNESNIKRIQDRFPVPREYRIRWVDIIALNGHPAGMVLTDQALIVKATKQEVKELNDQISIINKDVENKDKIAKYNYRYMIIPWELYDPEVFSVESLQDKGNSSCYQFLINGEEFAQFENLSLFNLITSYNSFLTEEKRKKEQVIENTTLTSINSVHASNIMFSATYSANNVKTGHGNFAERAGQYLDILNGEKSSVVGTDNAKNGPDKIVDTLPVQCKYCKTAEYSIKACFKTDNTGQKVFRYYDLNGEPMKIEVPSDQYTEVIDFMKQYIKEGNVPGVSDPETAYEIIRKGRITYKQARDLARAGTISSLQFDAITGAYYSLIPMGISATVAFAQVYWKTKDIKQAAKCALNVGIQVFGLSLASNVVASQLARLTVNESLKTSFINALKLFDPKTKLLFVNAYRALAGKNPLTSAKIPKSFSSFLRANLLTEGVFYVVFSLPDCYFACRGKISGSQYTKNMLVRLGTCAGSYVATTTSGAIISKSSSNISGLGETMINLGAGLAGGFAFGYSVKALLDLFMEDDAYITERLFNAVLMNMAIEYMLSDEEQNLLIEELNAEKNEVRSIQQELIKSKSQVRLIRQYLKPKCEKIVRNREKISEKEMEELNNALVIIFRDLVNVVEKEGDSSEM